MIVAEWEDRQIAHRELPELRDGACSFEDLTAWDLRPTAAAE